MWRPAIRLTAAAGMLLLTAGPVTAIDLTGTWEGTIKCTTHIEDTPRFRFNDDVSLLISQSGTALNVSVLGVLPAFGQATDDGDGSKGLMAFASCTPPVAGNNFIGDGKVTIGTSRSKIEGRWDSFSEGVVRTCTLKVQRTDTADPGVSPCP
jgi:hypothetical protein